MPVTVQVLGIQKRTTRAEICVLVKGDSKKLKEKKTGSDQLYG